MLKWGLPGGGVKSAKVAPTPYVYFPPVILAFRGSEIRKTMFIAYVFLALCRRAPVAVPMVESKWLSRPFWGREGPESGALHRGPPWVCSVHFLLLRLINTAPRDALATNAITKTAELTVIFPVEITYRDLSVEITYRDPSVAMFSSGRVSSSGLKLGVKCS